MGRRQGDPLRRLLGELLEPLEREHEVSATLGSGHRMDLIDDHRLDIRQGLTGLRGEHQEQRLGCRDQDVGRLTHELATVGSGRVARSNADRRRMHVRAEPFRREADALQGGSKVLLDIDGQRPQRREVEHSCAGLRILRHVLDRQPVQRPQERRQSLACACRSEDQGVVTVRDRGPALALRRSGFAEGGGEPLAHRVGERRQRIAHGRNLPMFEDPVPLGRSGSVSPRQRPDGPAQPRAAPPVQVRYPQPTPDSGSRR